LEITKFFTGRGRKLYKQNWSPNSRCSFNNFPKIQYPHCTRLAEQHDRQMLRRKFLHH